ncbi:MAG: hypothetical protein VYA80_01870 [Pseudomonadota bacterium]|nr:hypothetical protein [Pseudomonadota bacterium]
MKKLCINLSASIWFLLSGAAQAITIEWTLNDVVFTDGGTASGSFFYDTDTSTYSNVSIATTTGSIRSGENYGNPAWAWGSIGLAVTPLELSDYTGAPGLLLIFTGGPLIDPTATYGLLSGYQAEGICGSVGCDGGLSNVGVRSIPAGLGGTLTGTVVPIPAAVWLFGSALVLLGWMRKINA